MPQTLAYVRLQNSNASLLRRFRTLQANYAPGIEKFQTVRRTVTGRADVSEGIQFRTWEHMLRVRFTDPDALYGNYNDLITFFGYNNPNGTPSNVITYFDALDSNDDGIGDQYSVVIRNSFKPQPQTPLLTGGETFYLIQMVLEVYV